jgi:hypothetical protein
MHTEESGTWTKMTDEQLYNFMCSFMRTADEKEIPFSKFDYTKKCDLYNYYKKNFPKFTEDEIMLLIKCSTDKIYDERDDIVTFTRGKVKVDFD